jgi:hypothetical protein
LTWWGDGGEEGGIREGYRREEVTFKMASDFSGRPTGICCMPMKNLLRSYVVRKFSHEKN